MSPPQRSVAATPEAPEITSRLGSEFGATLAQLVAAVPGARGAVLSDEEGYTVDHARSPGRVAEIDLQLAGAQLAGPLGRFEQTCARLGLGRGWVLLQSSRGSLLVQALGARGQWLLVLVLHADANLRRAMTQFETAAATLAAQLP